MKTPRKAKTNRDFPLFLHQTGQWAKKVRGRTHYFGIDRAAALEKWLRDKDHLLAGRAPPRESARLTLRDLANRFLNSKKVLMDAGELSPRSWGHYFTTCEILLAHFGKTMPVSQLGAPDFEGLRAELAKTRGAHALSGEVQRVRTLFKYAWEERLVETPVRMGTAFKKPSRQAIRRARHETGTRMFEAKELRKLVEVAGVPMKAMILLGINCGFGQTDVASLPVKALDLRRRWVNFPRPKTQVARRCPLWPATVAALREAIEARPDARDEADSSLVFLTRFGKPWVRVKARRDDQGRPRAGVPIDSVRIEFEKLLSALGVKRPGLGFYALRHTFRTIADRSKDQPAVDHIMGHVRDDMASVYRERIDDDRLKAVVNVVRAWWRPPAPRGKINKPDRRES